MEPGELVPSVKGVIKVIFDAKTGKNERGDYRIESFVLKDGSDEIVVDLKNREPLDKALKGKQVTLISHVRANGGLSGIKRDEYNGKAKLSVTESAEMVRSDSVASAASAETEGAAKEPTPPAHDAPKSEPAKSVSHASGPVTAPASRAGKVEHIIKVQRHLGSRTNALRLAADATLRLVKSFLVANGVEYKADDIVPLVARHLCETTFTTMFIDLQKSFLLDDISSSDIDKLLAEAKEAALKGRDEKAKAEREAKIAKAKQLAEEAARLAREAEEAANQ